MNMNFAFYYFLMLICQLFFLYLLLLTYSKALILNIIHSECLHFSIDIICFCTVVFFVKFLPWRFIRDDIVAYFFICDFFRDITWRENVKNEWTFWYFPSCHCSYQTGRRKVGFIRSRDPDPVGSVFSKLVGSGQKYGTV